MKKYGILFFLSLILTVISYSQQPPMGMKYQAVARDLKGTILGEQRLTLKVTLAGNNDQVWSNYYTETHEVETSQLGLFTLVIGEGTALSGKFTEVPWSSQDIWMEVAIRDNSGFAIISNSKLLAVPFAFHALTAKELVGDNSRSAGVPSNVWSLFGNSNSNPLNDALGTTDQADLVIITNNVERMRLLADGNILIKRSLAIGANLTVDSNVVLNDKGGATTNNGPFTVARNSPTLLSGTLTVDLETDLNAALNVDGPTDLNSNLNVNNQKPTKLTGTLQVDGVTTLNDSFYVANSKPSVLTGYLRVDSNATFKQSIILDNPNLNQDTANLTPTGALQVAGGGGFGGNLTVAGSARIGGGLTLGTLKVTDTISSTSTTTGALTVAGGVGIAKQLNVGGKTVIENSLDVNAGNGQVKITGGADGDDQTSGSYPLIVNGKKQGIQVNLSGVGEPNSSNNFMTFRDNNGQVRGRIEGQTISELTSDPWYQWDVANLSLYVVWAGLEVVYGTVELIAAITDIRVCVGLGVVTCPPSPGTIVARVFVLAGKVVALAQQIVNLASYIINKNGNIGISFSSSAGDYAEWLAKENPSMSMVPGQVVGVRKGVISLNTDGAERVLAISTNPAVLGNIPDDGKESQFEKVAFLGQVPVRVTGKVKAGDYIIASGLHDGKGRAVDPQELVIDDISNIVGIAWTSSDVSAEKAVRVAVGLSANDLKTIVRKLDQKVTAQSAEFNELKKQFNENNAMLAKLVPGFKSTSIPVESIPLGKTVTVSQPGVQDNLPSIAGVGKDIPLFKLKADPKRLEKVKQEILVHFTAKLNNPEYERFPEMTDELIDKLLEWGTIIAEDNGAPGSASALINKVKSDPEFRNYLYSKMKQAYQQKIEEQKQINLEKR